MGIHHSPHTHTIPIPMGIPMGIPIPTAALATTEAAGSCVKKVAGGLLQFPDGEDYMGAQNINFVPRFPKIGDFQPQIL